MSAQSVTPELKQWILTQFRAGCRPEDILSAMRASGWPAEVAERGLEETLAAEARRPGDPNAPLPDPVPVPEPDLQGSPLRVWAADREVQVLMSMHNPRIVVFGGLLSAEECEAMMQAARPRLARSETVIYTTGGNEVNPARTSQGMFFTRGENEICARIEARLAALLRWPVENGEGLQVLHYRPGAEYRPHHDYFDPGQPGMASVLRRGGQRVATVVMYLNSPEAGGGTVFPEVGLEVAPIQGHAVFFSYDRAHPVSRSLHGGAPVQRGEKWVATKWLREREFV